MIAPIFHFIADAPKPVGPYSHVVEAGDWLFVTGQIATDLEEDDRPLPEGIEAQTRKVFDSLSRALAGVGASLEHVVCVRIFPHRIRTGLRGPEPDLSSLFLERSPARQDHRGRHPSGARWHRRNRHDRG
jgi:enamine deaminase RidA (YjgF/YER057c/UK114 family)